MGPIRPRLDGDARPNLCLTADFSLSFLFFLQMTRSPGCVSNCEHSGVCSFQPPETNLDSFWCLEEVDLVVPSPSTGVTPWGKALSGKDMVSNLLVGVCCLILLEEAGFGDFVITAPLGLEKVTAFLASRKSESGKAIFMISKNRPWSFSASHFTCVRRRKQSTIYTHCFMIINFELVF